MLLEPHKNLAWNKYHFDCAIYILVGGIYTVIRSKAYVSTEELGDQYILLGPYKEHCARTEVEEMEFQVGSPLHTAVTRMRERGFQVTRVIFERETIPKTYRISL